MGTIGIDFFMDHPEDFEKLTAEDQARVFEGGLIDGDISSVTPDAAADTATESVKKDGNPEANALEKSADDPAVLAKDGKHLIPFEELEAAREQARQWKQRAEEAAALAERLKMPDDSAAGAKNESYIDLDDLEMQAEDASLAGDLDTYRDIRKQINAEVERRAVSRAIEAVHERETQERQRAVEAAVQAEASKAIAKHPFLDHNGPNPNWEAIAQVRALRDLYADNGKPIAEALADAVDKVAGIYEPKKPEPAKPEDVAAKAAAVIAKAKTPPPNSMSSIPASSISHHDEAAALLEMSPHQLNEKFMSMTPDQIEKMMARLL